MKFELLNTHICCYPGNKDNDIEKIISKIMATEYKDKITVIRGAHTRLFQWIRKGKKQKEQNND